jgi:hypothetical protein
VILIDNEHLAVEIEQRIQALIALDICHL